MSKNTENGMFIRFKGLTTFGDRSLSLFLPNRSVLWGPNGSGKTSLLRAIASVFSQDQYFKRMLSRYSRAKELLIEVEYMGNRLVYRAYYEGRKTIEEREQEASISILPSEVVYFNPLLNPSVYSGMIDAVHVYVDKIKNVRKKSEEKFNVILRSVAYIMGGGDENYRQKVLSMVDISDYINNPEGLFKVMGDSADELVHRGERVTEYNKAIKIFLDLQEAYWKARFQVEGAEKGECPVCYSVVENSVPLEELHHKLLDLESKVKQYREFLQESYEEALRGWIVSSVSVPSPEEVMEAHEFLQDYPLTMLRRIESVVLSVFSDVKRDFEEISSQFVSEILDRKCGVRFTDSGRVYMDSIPYYLLSRGESSAVTLGVFLAYRRFFNIREFYPIIIDEGIDHLSPDSATRAVSLIEKAFPDTPLYFVSHRPDTLAFLKERGFFVITVPEDLEESEENAEVLSGEKFYQEKNDVLG